MATDGGAEPATRQFFQGCHPGGLDATGRHLEVPAVLSMGEHP